MWTGAKERIESGKRMLAAQLIAMPNSPLTPFCPFSKDKKK